jgi:hypothetical protein
VDNGAPDLSLVVADEQTMGKGRAGRRWYTPAGSALAFSLILSPAWVEPEMLPRFTGLGALAVKQALESRYGLPAKIKWPNDVLLQRRKLAGVLVEAHWIGIVLSLDLGRHKRCIQSIKEIRQREPQLIFPATCLEHPLGSPRSSRVVGCSPVHSGSGSPVWLEKFYPGLGSGCEFRSSGWSLRNSWKACLLVGNGLASSIYEGRYLDCPRMVL